jgi:hypothetical protein
MITKPVAKAQILLEGKARGGSKAERTPKYMSIWNRHEMPPSG